MATAGGDGLHGAKRRAEGGPRVHALLLASSALIAAVLPAAAQNATWLLNPGSGFFSDAANWTPATVPTGTAFFGTSNTTALVSSAFLTTVGGWTFNAGASNYTFTNSDGFFFNGAGIVINGGSINITNNNHLEFNNNSTAGSATITNNSVMLFTQTSTAGSAAITTNSSLQFFDTSTAGSATITNSGFLQFFDTSTAGSASITNNGANFRFLNSSTAGSAAITNNNSLFFDNLSTAGSATITNNATLNFLGSSTGGSAAITNNGPASLIFSQTSTAGSAAITNNGVINFNNASTAGNATITNNNNFLGFFDTSTAGSAAVTNNAILSFNNASTAGSATITNNSNLRFQDSSTAGSAAITNNGEVQFSNSSTAGSATITNNAFLIFLDSSTGGTARLINGAAGNIDLSGLANPGMTAGSIEGGGTISLSSKNLQVGGNNLSTTFSGVLQDGGIAGGVGGSFTKVGTGTLTLSGINTYTGATTVNAGTLAVNGSIATSALTTVNAGGTLAGTGAVGNTQVNSGGIFAPGSGVAGTSITVAGNLAFQSGALYLVQISPTTASFANVTGTASLAGTVLAQGSYAAHSYNILHATGGLGGTTFSGLTISSNPNFTASLSYSATDVFLNLTAVLGAGTGPLNQNQQNVAGAINGFFNDGGTLPPGFVNLFNLTGSNLTNALTLISGEAATGAQQGAFMLGGQFLNVMLDPFVDGRGGIGGPALGFAPDRPDLPDDIALAYSKVMKTPVYKAPPVAYEPRWTAWGAGYGGYNKTSGDPLVVGSHDLTARAGGVAAGLDYRVSRDAVFGFALAGGGTRWDLAQGLGGGKSDAFQAGAYAATRSGPAYLAASLAFTNHWMSTDRFAAFGDHLTASFNAQSIGARLESGYRFGTPAFGFTPYGAVQAQSFRTPTYSEVDVTAGGFGLTYNSRTATDTRGELGARFDHVALVYPGAVLTLRGRLAWAHDWVSDPSLAAIFQALPGAGFTVNGALPAKNAALASAGAELKLANGVAFIGKFDGEFAGRSNTYAGTGTVRFAW